MPTPEAFGTSSFKVIGAGFGRTGTLSLKLALEQLGFGPCHHMGELFAHPEQAEFWGAAARGDPVDWQEGLSGYQSDVDWPICTYYRELADLCPHARVLLSARDPKAWFQSVQQTIGSKENQEKIMRDMPGQDFRDISGRIPKNQAIRSQTRRTGWVWVARRMRRLPAGGDWSATDTAGTGYG